MPSNANFYVGEFTSHMHVRDGSSTMTPAMREEIVRIVLEVVEQRDQHYTRVTAEQRITGGVRDEQEGES